MQHVMVDLETLGTTPDSIILSIGACRFDLDSDQIDDVGFTAIISAESNQQAGRRLSDSTISWWMKQTAAAQSIFHAPSETLECALRSFRDWFGTAEFIWSNGASFDIPMLTHAMNSFDDLDPPWHFYNERCVRTFKTLPGMKNVKPPDNPLAHSAFHDAIYQARQVQMIQAKLKSFMPVHPMQKVMA